MTACNNARDHEPGTTVESCTDCLRTRIAALEAESQADKRLIDRLTVVCEDCPDDSHCEVCDDSGVVPLVRVRPCHDADAVPGEVVVWSDGHEHRFVPTSSYAALEAEREAELVTALHVVLGSARTYGTIRVLQVLAEATEHLFDSHDCDVHGWEVFDSAAKAARELLAEIEGSAAVRAALLARLKGDA